MLCDTLGLPETVCAVLLAFTELTSAASYVASAYNGSPLTASPMLSVLFFAVGFNGMSAHMQLASFAIPSGISLKKHYRIKLLTAILSGATGYIFLIFLQR